MINLSRFIISTFLILLLAVPCLAAPSLIISGHPNYPPYMWNKNGSLVGIGPEIAKTICKELGFTCEQRPLHSWKRVQELARNGDIDMIVGAFSNLERRSYMDYSKAYMLDSTNVFVRKNHSFPVTTHEDLIGKQGVAMFGESFGQELDKFIDNKLKLSHVYSVKALFLTLQSGRADYILWGYYPWFINAQSLGATVWCKALPNPIVEEGMHLTFSKKGNFKELLPAINKIIDRLQNDGSINRWREQFLQQYQDYPSVNRK